jgi:hypothetical protein
MWTMMKSMLVMVTTLFQDNTQKRAKDMIDLRVRLFLSAFEAFEKPMQKKIQEHGSLLITFFVF